MKYIKKQPKKAKIQFMPIRLNYIRHWRELALKPQYACGMFFMKTIEYITQIIVILFNRD
jgi:hypothetical protein